MLQFCSTKFMLCTCSHILINIISNIKKQFFANYLIILFNLNFVYNYFLRLLFYFIVFEHEPSSDTYNPNKEKFFSNTVQNIQKGRRPNKRVSVRRNFLYKMHNFFFFHAVSNLQLVYVQSILFIVHQIQTSLLITQ